MKLSNINPKELRGYIDYLSKMDRKTHNTKVLIEVAEKFLLKNDINNPEQAAGIDPDEEMPF